MPALSFHGPDAFDAAARWFQRPAGQAILDSEQALIAEALRKAQAGLPWLWISPSPTTAEVEGRGLRLTVSGECWEGVIRCRLPLPIASESLGAVVLQHVAYLHDARSGALLAECARALVPGGHLHLFALNPLSPYRLRWQRSGIKATDSARLRGLLRDVGLTAEPSAQGVGPQWSVVMSSRSHQYGIGLRAAYWQRADKRQFPLTPIRSRKPLALSGQVPVA